jgi:hypothetical protein
MRALAVLVLVALPWAATGQELLDDELGPSPSGPLGDPTTCADYAVMDSLQQAQALSGIEPLGGEIDPADPEESAGWRESVMKACEGHPDRPLSVAAEEALRTP